MGPVYLARQIAHNRDVAIKRILGAWNGEPQELERFQREARVLARLNHPNIVGIDEVIVEANDLFLVTDYVRGSSLRQLMSRGGVTRAQALRTLADMARALTYAAGRSILHGDLKPGNVFVTQSGVGKIGDFGLVKMLSGSDSLVSSNGAILGTPAYISPEHAAGRTDIGPRADIYSMAVMAYELLVGQLPYPSVQGNVGATLDAHISAPVPRPSTIAPGFPSSVEQVLMSALAKEPSQRPATADDFWMQLSSAADAAWPGWATEDDVPSPPEAAPGSQPTAAADLPESFPIAAAPPTPSPPAAAAVELPLTFEPAPPDESAVGNPAPVVEAPPTVDATTEVEAPSAVVAAAAADSAPVDAPEVDVAPAIDATPMVDAEPVADAGSAANSLPVPEPPAQPPRLPPLLAPVDNSGLTETDDLPTRRERQVWPLAVALFVGVVAAAALIAYFPLHLFRNGAALRVNSISAAVTPASGHCPSARYVFTASVMTNGQGGPLTYEWAKPDQRVTDVKSASIPDGETNATATLEFTFQGQGSTSGDAILHILTPNDVKSAPVHIVYECP
jgi:hypothetical protein